MPRRKVNLKKRLDELRNEPEPPVEVALQIDAGLYQTLRAAATREGLALETYLVRILTDAVTEA